MWLWNMTVVSLSLKYSTLRLSLSQWRGVIVLTFCSNVFHIIIPLLYQESGTLDVGKTNIVHNLSLILGVFFFHSSLETVLGFLLHQDPIMFRGCSPPTSVDLSVRQFSPVLCLIAWTSWACCDHSGTFVWWPGLMSLLWPLRDIRPMAWTLWTCCDHSRTCFALADCLVLASYCLGLLACSCPLPCLSALTCWAQRAACFPPSVF